MYDDGKNPIDKEPMGGAKIRIQFGQKPDGMDGEDDMEHTPPKAIPHHVLPHSNYLMEKHHVEYLKHALSALNTGDNEAAKQCIEKIIPEEEKEANSMKPKNENTGHDFDSKVDNILNSK